MKVSNDYWRCVQRKSYCMLGKSWFKKKDVYNIHVVEDRRRKGGRQGIDGLCVVTKTNAWKTVRCESVQRRRWRNV